MEKVFYTDSFNADSTAMDSVYYARDVQKMYIFWKNGTKSAYDYVTQAMYDNFKNTESKGSYWNRNITKSSNWPVGDTDVILQASPAIQNNDMRVWEVTIAVNASSIEDALSMFPNEDIVAVKKSGS